VIRPAVAVIAFGLALAVAATPVGREAVRRVGLISLERTINTVAVSVSGDSAAMPSERSRLWQVAVLMWRSAPILGVGEGSFAWRFHDFAPAGSPLDTPSYGDAHNLWLQLLATRGAAGFLALGAVVLMVGRALWRRRFAQSGDPTATGPLLAFTGFLAYSTVSALFYLQSIQVLFWWIVAAASASSRDTPLIVSRTVVRVSAGAFVVFAAGALYSNRDRWADAAAEVAQNPRGFYAIESGPLGPMRWSSGSGTLCLQPESRHVRLRFAVVDPRVPRLPRLVRLQLDGNELDRFEILTPEAVDRLVELPDGVRTTWPARLPFGECTPETPRLGVSVSRTWSPADTGFGADARRLGVLLFEPTYDVP
jgi:hypothetical protein